MNSIPLPWQTDSWRTLYNAGDRLPHAFLIVGPRGIGKFVFAQALAQALLCERPKVDGIACGACMACGWFIEGTHPDFRLVTPESEQAEEAPTKKALSTAIKIDQIRALSDFFMLSAHQGGRRIILINPADAMNNAASNSLLKNLEEPPAATIFILVAQQAQRLLPTLRSRCRTITLSLPSKEMALPWLQAQGVKNPDLLLAQAGLAPLRALDMNEEDYLERRAEFLRSLSNLNIQVALETAEHFAKFELSAVLDWLQKWTYDLVCLKCGDEIRYSLDFAKELKGIVVRMDTLKLLRYNSHLVEARRFVSHPLNVQLVLEDALLSYLELFSQEPAYV